MANIPTNKALYNRVKAEAKRKFDTWPSAYASAWLVKTYKKRGGGYKKAEMGMEVENPYADMYSIGGGIMMGDYEMGYGGTPEYGYGGEEYSEGGMPEYKSGGGIPQRYKNKGFTKVGAKKKSTRPGKKWMVLAKKGDQYKIVHGGDSNMKDFSQHGSAERQKRFWDRMGGKSGPKAQDPFSPLYWHKRFGTWAEGGEFEPHMMYNPETGEGFMAEEMKDHLAMNEMGFTHDAPEMGYGGDLYKAAAGAAIVPIIKAVAPAVMGAFNKNKQAPAPQPSINIYNTTPQQSMNTGPFVERPSSTEEMMYGNGGYKYAQGGTNNPGFKALPKEVQANIIANMMYGGDMYAMGGAPCFECGGSTYAYGGQPKYQFAGTAMGSPFTSEEEDYMQDQYGTSGVNGDQGDDGSSVSATGMNPLQPKPTPSLTPALPTMNLAPVFKPEQTEATGSNGTTSFGDGVSTLAPGMSMAPTFKPEGYSAEQQVFGKQNRTPGESYGNAFANKFASGYLFKNGKFNPTLQLTAPGSNETLQIGTFDALDGLSKMAGAMGKRKKEEAARRRNMQQTMTDNLYAPIEQGSMGSRGNYNTFGELRPDRLMDANPYTMESFLQEGGETELTDAEIARLRAMGADIEILD